MGYSSEFKSSSADQQTPKLSSEKIALARANRNRRSRDTCKLENPFGQPYISQDNEKRHCSSKQPVAQLNSSHDIKKNCIRNNTSKDDELVKHMRNLPGYLQQEGTHLQGKALNFGVLDWGRLENWKSNEKRIIPRVSPKTPSSTNKPPLIRSVSSRGKSVQSQDSVATQRKILNTEQNPCWQDASSNDSRINQAGGKSVVELDNVTKSGMETSSPVKFSNCTVSARISESKTRFPDEISPGQDCCTSGQESIVLLLPKHSRRHSSSRSFHLPKPRPSFDKKLTEAGEMRFSDCLSPEEFFTTEPFSEIPHSCPLPLGAETNNDSCCPIEMADSSTASEFSKTFYHDIAEQPYGKERHTSPNRRFSFSLGKMTRSLSFKESSGVPQLSSTYTSAKSGPVKSEASTDYFNRDRRNASGRSRSSPLRRLLDPLLRSKGPYPAESVQQPLRWSEVLQNKKHESSGVQALLQLTMKNGIPFFKLVVDNSSNILAAAVKKIPTAGTDDSSLIYSFYSVHEIKKKNGGWMNQGSKEKSVGFGYNIVGQMKVSSSYDQDVVRESVLYSADIGQGAKRTPDFTPNRELAAIIITESSDENDEREQICKSAVVVLPGGVHSLPSHGVPSPLIMRWRSGGSCDCGGWDVGCKLRVLTNQEDTSEIMKPLVPCSRADCINLFHQSGNKENNESFNLALVKNGLYSLECDASISLLQAFSVCVAVVSSQKLAHIFQVQSLSEQRKMTDNARTKGHATPQPEVPAKYVTLPPPSPVGRV